MNKQEFLQKYKVDIQQEILKFECRRKELVFDYSLFIFTTIIFSLIFFFVVKELAEAISNTNTLLFSFSVVIVFFLLALKYWLFCLEGCTKNIEEFLLEMKKKFLNRILNFWGNITWSVDSSIPNLKAEKLTGEYKNIPFKILETKNDIYLTFKSNKIFKYETLVKNKRHLGFKFDYRIASFICSTLITIIVIAVLINSNNKTELVLKEYIFDSIKFILLAIVSGIYSIGSIINFYTKYKKTKIEDIELTKDFIIYTENEIDARYFLTPSFIERFKNFQTALGRKNINCSCKNNEVCFKITKPKNLFEVCNVFKPLNDISVVSELYNEIDAIFKMIDYFKLNENTKI